MVHAHVQCIALMNTVYPTWWASKLWFSSMQSLTQWVTVAIMVVSTVKLVLMTYCVSQYNIASSTARCRMWPTFGEDSEYIYTLYTAVSCPFGLTPRHGHASRIAARAPLHSSSQSSSCIQPWVWVQGLISMHLVLSRKVSTHYHADH